jgi:hypothetical protein
VIGDTGTASERTLEPLYRILKGDKTEDERTVAEASVRGIWQKAEATASNGRAPTGAVVEKLVDKVKPSKSSSSKGQSKPKASTASKTETAEQVDSAAVEASSAEVAKILGSAEKALPGVTPVLRAALLAVARLCIQHGAINVQSALSTPDANGSK